MRLATLELAFRALSARAGYCLLYVVPRTVIQIQSSFTDQIQQHAHHKEKHSKPKEPLSRSAHQLRHRVLVEARHLQRLLLVESGKS